MVSHLILWGIAFLFLWLAEVGYFKIATRYHIVDKPNERSSHARLIIRGGGIIFPVSIIAWHFSSSFLLPWFVLAMVVAAVVSFVDDIVSVNFLVRIFFQLAAILLIFYQESIFHYPLPVVGAALIICVGTLNAFNFMDGINGITGVYSLVTLLSLLYVHLFVEPFTDFNLLIWVLLALIVFLFFNFRKDARCFAGDVGSVIIALIIVFLLIQLVMATGYGWWIFLLLIYGMDSVITIVMRLSRRENIFKAHRTHLYQFFSNELRYHRLVSVTYGAWQLIVNGVLIYSYIDHNYFLSIAAVAVSFLLYIVLRYSVVKKITPP